MTIQLPSPAIDTFVGLLGYINTITGGLAGVTLLVGIFIMSFVAMRTTDNDRAFAGSLFVTSIVGVAFSLIGFLSTDYAIIPIILFGISILALRS